MTEFTRWVVIDDNDSRLSYSGSWSRSNGDRYNNQGNFGQTFDNSLHTTTSASSVSYSFTGNAAKIYGTTDLTITDGVGDPDWDCILDGNVVGDAKTAPFRFVENNWEFCNFVNLSAGQHTVSLAAKPKGKPFLFDRLHYRPTNPVENERILATRDDADITYSQQGKWGPLAQNGYFTHERGATVSFPFIGNRVELRAMAPTERAHGASEATYSIDGGDEIPFTIREVGGISDYNRKVFETPQLSQGRHVLTVTYRGAGNLTPLVVDGFIVSSGTNRRAPEPAAPAPVPAPNSPNPNPDPGSNSPRPSGDGSDNGGDNSSTTGTRGGSGSSSGSSGPTPTSVSDVRPEDSISRVVFIKTSNGASEPTPGAGDLSDSATKDTDSVGATKGSNNTGAIIGGILGAVAIILLAIGLFSFMRRRRARQRRVSSFAATGFNPSYMGNFNDSHGPYQHQPQAPMSYSSTAAQWSQSGPAPDYAPSSTHARTLSDPRSDVPSSSAVHLRDGVGQPYSFPDAAPPVYRH